MSEIIRPPKCFVTALHTHAYTQVSQAAVNLTIPLSLPAQFYWDMHPVNTCKLSTSHMYFGSHCVSMEPDAINENQ